MGSLLLSTGLNHGSDDVNLAVTAVIAIPVDIPEVVVNSPTFLLLTVCLWYHGVPYEPTT